MKRILFLCTLFFSFITFSQRNVSDTIIGTPYVGVQYTAVFPGGDLADRYGFLNQIGAFAGYKTAKNWIYGLDGNFIFGNRINDNSFLDNFITAGGTITAASGAPATVLLLSRGFYGNVTVGKIIPVLSPNPNSGLMFKFGIGYIYHKIRIETQEDFVPQFEEEYKKGYDRLTIGLSTSQFVGYSFMANRGVYNFYAGFYFNQGFTRNQRDLFWDQPEIPVSKDIRLDLQFGLRAGWLIPIYKRQPKEFYFN